MQLATKSARMRSLGGWIESGQLSKFDGHTLMLGGLLRVTYRDGVIDVTAAQTIHTRVGEWVHYSAPNPEGADYVAACLPAFLPQTMHRDGQGE